MSLYVFEPRSGGLFVEVKILQSSNPKEGRFYFSKGYKNFQKYFEIIFSCFNFD
jgi:hypothetical protein